MAQKYITGWEIVKKWGIPASTVDTWRRDNRNMRVTSPRHVRTVGGKIVDTSERIVFRYEDIKEIIAKRKRFGITNSAKWWEQSLPPGWEKLSTVTKRTGVPNSTIRRAIDRGLIKSKEIKAYGTRYGKVRVVWKEDVDKFLPVRLIGRGRRPNPAAPKVKSLVEQVIERFGLKPLSNEEAISRKLTTISFHLMHEWRRNLGNFRLPRNRSIG